MPEEKRGAPWGPALRVLPYACVGALVTTTIGGWEQLGLSVGFLWLGVYLVLCEQLAARRVWRLLLVPLFGLGWLAVEAWTGGLEQGWPTYFAILRRGLSHPFLPLLLLLGASAQLLGLLHLLRAPLPACILGGGLLGATLFLHLHCCGLSRSVPTVHVVDTWLLGAATALASRAGHALEEALAGPARLALRPSRAWWLALGLGLLGLQARWIVPVAPAGLVGLLAVLWWPRRPQVDRADAAREP